MFIRNLLFSRLLCLAAVAATVSAPAFARFVESESNDTKATADVVALGTATSATIRGDSAGNTDPDYFRISTTYTTPGIYRNQIQLDDTTSFTASLRGLTQAASVISSSNDVLFQASQRTGSAQPYGFNQYYSFGGEGKTQTMNYRIIGATMNTGGSYVATFTSSLVTPTSIGSFVPGTINFAALANQGTGGVTNSEIMVFDSGFKLYADNVAGSPTLGLSAANDNSTNTGFSLTRQFGVGTYYIAIGVSNIATNAAAPTDDTNAGRNALVLETDNVIATTNTFYDGNNGNTRPSDFSVTDSAGKVYTSSGQVVPSLYALNFYSFTVAPAAVVPEAGTLTLVLPVLGLVAAGVVRRRNRKGIRSI